MLINPEKIRLIAAEQGMNTGQLAEKAGISRQALSTAFTRKTCRPETIVKLSNALSVAASELSGGN